MTAYVLVRVHPDDEGVYLAEYDPDWRPPGVLGAWTSGLARWNADVDEAMEFVDHAAAFACWRRQSITVPWRPDGQPNRPLTAFSVVAIPRSILTP